MLCSFNFHALRGDVSVQDHELSILDQSDYTFGGLRLDIWKSLYVKKADVVFIRGGCIGELTMDSSSHTFWALRGECVTRFG